MQISQSEAPRSGVERLLRPRSVAIVGASEKPGALGASVLANLERNGFGGDIHLINPNRATIGGRACLATVADLPNGVDVAVLAIPRAAVVDNVRMLAAKGVGAAIIFSAGFAEDGEAGLADQRRIAEIARESGMMVEGPNCLGFVNYVDRIPLTFVETQASPPGSRPGIGIVSQSGAMAAVLSVMLVSRDLPLSFSISTGNEAASGVETFVEYLAADPATKVIALIVEQFRDPQRFLELASRARDAGKILVLLHPGKSSAARSSAATHTGALAGDYAVMRAKVARAGVIMAETLEELSDCADIAITSPCLPMPGAAIVGESGAFKALALDLAEDLGLYLPVLSDAVAPALRDVLPGFVAASNPLDLTAQGLVDPGIYTRTLDVLLSDDRFGSIAVGVIQTNPATVDIKLPAMLDALRRNEGRKAVVLAGLDEGAIVPQHYIREARGLGVAYLPSPERALRALARMARREAEAAPAHGAPAAPLASMPALPRAHGSIAEYEAKDWLSAAGVRFPERRLARTPTEARQAAGEIGYPVVLKAQSADLGHKSEAGGVILNVADDAALSLAWTRLHANIAAHNPGLSLEGVLVERMSRGGTEMIIGARRDPDWGPVVLVGFGGVMAELLKDTVILTPDVSLSEVIAAFDRLVCARLLRGFRGAPAADVEAAANIALVLASIMDREQAIAEIDLNPVVVLAEGEGAVALDALISLRD